MLLPVNQLVDIISSDELNVRNEEQVFNAVMGWVRYNMTERRPHLPTVRVPSLDHKSSEELDSTLTKHQIANMKSRVL